MKDMGNSIEILGYKCGISHPCMYKCIICGNSGHWEDKCDIVKIDEEKLSIIETELEKL